MAWKRLRAVAAAGPFGVARPAFVPGGRAVAPLTTAAETAAAAKTQGKAAKTTATTAAKTASAEEAAGPSPKRFVMASLRFRAYEPAVLDNYARFVQAVAHKMGVTVSGTVPLPRRIRKFTVLRSPHIDKKSREQFEMRTSSRLIQVVDTAPESAGAFVKYVEEHLPSGVALRVKETQHAAVPFVYK